MTIKMNLNDKIPECPDFRWREFIGYLPWEKQEFLIMNLAKLLQAVRGVFRVEFHIRHAVRSWAKSNELKAKGYAVANRTDHSYLDPMVYQFGVGAADFTIDDKKLLPEIFDYYVNQGRDGKLHFGQVIWYPPAGPEVKSQNIIHLSNPRRLVFTKAFCETLPPKRKYLIYVAEEKRFRIYEQSNNTSLP